MLAILFSLSRAAGDEAFFETKIRPVLAGVCVQCHGAIKQSGGLRLDSRPGLLAGGDGGPAVVPGKPDESLLITAIRRGGDIEMPPDEALSADHVSAFEQWIAAGAKWPQESAASETTLDAKPLWSFVPVKATEPPASDWSDHPIDRWIAARWQTDGLKPVAAADKITLLRRTYFDLIGLPPTPDEVATFLADDSDDAFTRLVDCLLESPRYGERWGRHWMDVVHYADTAGDNADYPVPEAHLYRDYIIDSFNRDRPYDEFVREQLAGDILARQGERDKYAERVIATGFLALTRRYGTAPGELWQLVLEDTLDTVGQALLGLTIRCARCHDHKFDPITTSDYYAMYGIFNSTKFAYAGSEETNSKNLPRAGFVPLAPEAEVGPSLERFAAEIATREATISAIEKTGPLAQEIVALEQRRNEQAKLDAVGGGASTAESEQLQKQLDEKSAERKSQLDQLRGELTRFRRAGLPADVPGAYAVQEGTPADASIQEQGEPSHPGPVVPRGVPMALRGEDRLRIPDGASGRLELAQWLTRPENPLTARVMVNRIWQHHFGRGLVTTPSNFGLRGATPSHPELLDWLASQFVERGWSIKSMHRLIMASRVYQLASANDEHNAGIDPGNTSYWRFNRRRLDAEALRDAMLSVGGSLDLNRPGAHPFPAMDTWNWTQHKAFKEIYPSQHRSVFLMTQRLQRHPYLALFDGPDTNHTTDVRTSATVPLQALFLMNNPLVIEQSRGLARRLLAERDQVQPRVDLASRIAWSRPATPAEVSRAVVYIERCTHELQIAEVNPDEVQLEAWSSLAKIMLTANEFLYVD